MILVSIGHGQLAGFCYMQDIQFSLHGQTATICRRLFLIPLSKQALLFDLIRLYQLFIDSNTGSVVVLAVESGMMKGPYEIVI